MTAVLFLDKASLVLLQAEIEHSEWREEGVEEHCVDAGFGSYTYAPYRCRFVGVSL